MFWVPLGSNLNVMRPENVGKYDFNVQKLIC
jgi:hypothetical protein